MHCSVDLGLAVQIFAQTNFSLLKLSMNEGTFFSFRIEMWCSSLLGPRIFDG
jgi:hypothetical protein